MASNPAEHHFALAEAAEKKHDFAQARSSYEHAASQSHPIAAWRLACLLRHGTDVMDEATAMRWLRQSANAGHLPSRFLLVRQVWNGRIEGGKVRAARQFVVEIAHTLALVLAGGLRSGNSRLKK